MSEKQVLVTASHSHSVAKYEGLLERVTEKALAHREKHASVLRFPALTLSSRALKLPLGQLRALPPYWPSADLEAGTGMEQAYEGALSTLLSDGSHQVSEFLRCLSL